MVAKNEIEGHLSRSSSLSLSLSLSHLHYLLQTA